MGAIINLKRDNPIMPATFNVTAYPIKKITPIEEGSTILPPSNHTTNGAVTIQKHDHIMLAAIAIIGMLLGIILAVGALYLYRRAIKRKRKAAQRRSGALKKHSYQLSSTIRASQFTVLEEGEDIESLKDVTKSTQDTSSSIRAHHINGTFFKMMTPNKKNNLRIATPSTFTAFSLDDTASTRTEDDRSIQLNQAILDSPVVGKVLTEKFDVESPCRSGHFDWNECAFEDQEEEAMWLPPSGRNSPSAASVLSPRLLHGRATSDTLLLNFPEKAHVDARRRNWRRSDFSPPTSPAIPLHTYPKRRAENPRSILKTSASRQKIVRSMVSFSEPQLQQSRERVASPVQVASIGQTRPRASTAIGLERAAFSPALRHSYATSHIGLEVLHSEAQQRLVRPPRNKSPQSLLQFRRGAIAEDGPVVYNSHQR